LSLFSSKLAERSKNIAKYKDELKALQYVPIEPQAGITETMSLAARKAVINISIAIKQPTLGNKDLGYIVNGCEGEKLHDRPFDFTFTQERILNADAHVSFVPFTRVCFKNKNVRHEMNQEHTNTDIERINEECQDAKKKLKDEGFRVEGLFDVEIVTSASVKQKEREEDHTVELLKRKGPFSASGIYRNIGSMCVSCPSVTKK